MSDRPVLSPLPIDAVLPEVIRGVSRSTALVLQAETGAGKTTRVPPALWEAGLAGTRQVILLQPRRLAARTAAQRMAWERGGRVGGEIGYQIRFERNAGRETKILVVTEGLLTRMLQADPFLEAAGVVVLDEFHERHLDTDLSLAMLKRVQQTVRPDLKIVVMSATIAAEPVAQYLGNCPIVRSAGRAFPVNRLFLEGAASQPLPQRVLEGATLAAERTNGDILVFLPGVGEIRQCRRSLERSPLDAEFEIHELYGDLPAARQDAVLRRGNRRKIVLATNVAETSLTIDGITAVVDSGLARVVQFDPHTGLDRLRLTPISKAAAEQRAGRAGRLAPGLCIRLWSEAMHRARPEFETPEIRRVDLSSPVLQLRCWGENDLAAFPWFEPPREASLRRAERTLRFLGALDDHGPTETGRRLCEIPTQPRLAKLLVEGARRGVVAEAAMAAALLSERDPFRGEDEKTPNARTTPRAHRAASRSDLFDRVQELAEYERTGRLETPFGRIQPAAAQFALKARDQLRRALERTVNTVAVDADRSPSVEERFRRSLWAAFPDRLARRRSTGSPRGVMVGGKGVVLDSASAVREGEFFLCLDVDSGKTEARVRMASQVEPEWIAPSQRVTTIDVVFEEASERLSARRRVRFEDLILEESPAAAPTGDDAAQVLADAALARWDRVFPPDPPEVPSFLERVACLRQWMPELELPEFSEERWKSLLPTIATGCRSFAELKRAPWLEILKLQFTRQQLAALDREAPERIEAPSGSRIALTYEAGRPPVLAVRIQEVFGWKETPRIAGGRIRVLLHLLAPNHRPQQITDDLASFWANGYPIVRKELRARYPKHSWPDDPTEATAQCGPRRRT